MPPQIPQRFREEQFRRYEKYIYNAIEAYPQAIKCDPHLFDVATATFVGRLRDAIISYHDNHWQSTINRAKFISCWGQIQVIQRRDGTILVGPRAATKGWIDQDKVGEVVVPDEMLDTLHLTPELKPFIMKLSHARMLQPRIKVSGLTDEDVDLFQKQYDIAIDKNLDGTYTII